MSDNTIEPGSTRRRTLPRNGAAAGLVLGFLLAATSLIVNLAPIVVTGVSDAYGLDADTAGFVFAANVLGTSLGALVLSPLVEKINWRKSAAVTIVLMIGVDFATAVLGINANLFVLRFLSGLGVGAMIAMVFSVYSKTSHPERMIAYFTLLVIFLSGSLLVILPVYIEEVGISVLWYTLIVFYALALLTLPFLDSYPPLPDKDEATSTHRAPALFIASILLAVFLFQVGTMASFIFAIEIGISHGMDFAMASGIVGVTYWVGAAGALFVIWLATKKGRTKPLLFLGILVSFGSLFLLSSFIWAFLFACVTLSLGFSMYLPYLMGVAAEMDNTGKAAAFSAFSSSVGLAFGPAIGSLLVGDDDFSKVVYLTAGLYSISVLLAFAPAKMLDKKNYSERVTW
ncbi:putative 3-hydroxyphenylpropionic transporter MhpT [Ruegeria denitrificans]|uniref:Putative 3-hydroxyphenylpropionic transporter MhpT n=1 Tax=Ruegeria denitrificans TaxID=1715692 RepID=A0A0P1IJY4_9RHOB|nr:MFS transporter [Ruegeria denitrificans]CUK18265.1 putative 3-hydroxyphenylpropionic transporter MhpT [Ruegeria denitrificans]